MRLDKNILEYISKNEGDSFYILDTQQFSENFDRLLGEFQKHYPKTNIAYSYKTNYIPRLCGIVKEKGGFAEVVSGMEMTLAKKVCVDYKDIYFNGPVKGNKYIKELLENDGKVNVDSLEELQQILEISKENSKILKIGIRCNFDVGDGVISRFGFDVNGNEFQEAISIIKSSNHLKLIGLHCHIATRSLDSWENRTLKMIETLENSFSNNLESLEYISLGGGMSGDMPKELREQFSNYIPSFNEYAEVSSKVFAKYLESKNLKHKPTLLIEPGTALAANSLKYVTKIVSIKQVKDRIIATLSGSSYNIMPGDKKLPISIYKCDKKHQYYSNIYFAGYTCIESDYLYKEYDGEISIGDFVVFDEVGSYSVVMKPPFINPNVAIVEIKDFDLKEYKIIKEKETFDDIFHTYNIERGE